MWEKLLYGRLALGIVWFWETLEFGTLTCAPCLCRQFPVSTYIYICVIFNFLFLKCNSLSQAQAALVKDPGVSVNRIIWSPDGSLFGKFGKPNHYLASECIWRFFSFRYEWNCFIFFSLVGKTGVAYSLHIVQIFSYHGGEDLRQHREVNLSIAIFFSCKLHPINFVVLTVNSVAFLFRLKLMRVG